MSPAAAGVFDCPMQNGGIYGKNYVFYKKKLGLKTQIESQTAEIIYQVNQLTRNQLSSNHAVFVRVF